MPKGTALPKGEYAEEDYLLLSDVQKYVFCRRLWGLVALEGAWEDNFFTVDGHLLHEKVHDPAQDEWRGGVLLARAVPVCSRSLGLAGECDLVEFHPAKRESNRAVCLPRYEGIFRPVPVEVKRGKAKPPDEQTGLSPDEAQLCAQAICLEEMLLCDIPEGYLYYDTPRRRQKIVFTQEMRAALARVAREMHTFAARCTLPPAKKSKACRACSLNPICLPSLLNRKTVREYMDEAERE